ncbi:MAG TPA: excinuclease ABC subunit C [Neisseriales bacterium]|nr:excinuclease ABC subunit C [Neisseriales bacterium]
MRILVSLDNLFLQQIPHSPGVYRYYSADELLLYVGKALDLHKRVKSYFQKKIDLSPRIGLMVSKIHSIELTVTENETSALLLESNLIKSLKPKYNIIFRDDKSYPYIKISTHQYPLIEYFRGKPQARDTLFGPYPNPYVVRENLDLLQRLFKLRTCTDGSFANRSRPCMLFQVNLCCAPCVEKVSPVEYAEYVKYAKDFLCGNFSDLVAKLSQQMYQFAEQLEFEQASSLRDKIGLIRELQHKQIVSDSNLPINADILLTREYNQQLFIYLIIIRNGLYVGDKHFVQRLVDSKELILEAFLESYYRSEQLTRLIYLDQALNSEFNASFYRIYGLKLVHGFKGRLAELALMGRKNLEKVIENSHLDNIYIDACSKLATLLQVERINRIECYDTSHNHGSSAVAAMTVYANGKIDHSLYRKFNLNDSINGDDLLALETVLKRRLANKELPVPEVILVDGGKTQLAISKKLIDELGFCDKIKLIAIFKGEQRKAEFDKVIIDTTIELTFLDEPLLFKLLQMLRDEAHRFAITGHRKKQQQRMQTSQLEDIAGIGASKRKALIAFFGSATAVANAGIEQLQQVDGVGGELANSIYKHFHR